MTYAEASAEIDEWLMRRTALSRDQQVAVACRNEVETMRAVRVVNRRMLDTMNADAERIAKLKGDVQSLQAELDNLRRA